MLVGELDGMGTKVRCGWMGGGDVLACGKSLNIRCIFVAILHF